MNIIKMKLQDLKEAEYNPRQITAKELDNLKKSIHKFGYIEPIIYNTKLDHIVGGHQRKKALELLGVSEVDVVEVSLDQDEEKALNIALNKISGQWKEDDLLTILQDLDTKSMLDLTGFNDLELKDLTKLVAKMENEALEAEEDDFDESNVSENKYNVKRGDIYLLGNHRLGCLDSTLIFDMDKLMSGNKANLVLTDPPYNTGMCEKTNNGSTWLNHMFNDSFTDEEWKSFLLNTINIIDYYLKNDSLAYIFLDWRRSYELIPCIKTRLKLSNVIVWDKVVHGLGSDYKYTYELIHVCKKGKPILNTHYEQEYQDIWHIQRKMGKDEEHATKKPIELLLLPIKHATQENDVVLDLFGGSGSTLIACEQTKRICYISELEPNYCSVIIERYIKLKGSEQVYKLNEDGSKTHIGELNEQ